MEYQQEFLWVSRLDQYPEIKALAKKLSPKEKVQKCIYTCLAPLLITDKVAVSRTNDWYARQRHDWLRLRPMLEAQDILEDKKLIQIIKGRPARNGYASGFSSRLIRTPHLEKHIEDIIVEPIALEHKNGHIAVDRQNMDLALIHAISGLKKPITKKELTQAYKTTKQLNENYFTKIKLSLHDDTTNFILRSMPYKELKKMGKHMLLITESPRMTRMFARNGYGRFFERAPSYQYLKKDFRSNLLINGEKTRDVDFSGMHLNIAYHLMNEQNPFIDDPYLPVIEQLGVKPEHFSEVRQAAKRTLLIAFNTENRKSCLRAIKYHHRKEVGILKKHDIQVGKLYDAFLKAHKRIEPIFVSWPHKANELMFHESNIMKNILHRLQDNNILAVPLHDAALTTRPELTRDIMIEEYQNYTGNHIKVKIE